MVLHRDTGEKNLIWKRSTPCAQVLVVVTLQNCDCTPEFPPKSSDASNPKSRSKTAICTLHQSFISHFLSALLKVFHTELIWENCPLNSASQKISEFLFSFT